MNSNEQILEVLLKISQSLDEIKTHMTGSVASQVVDVKKIEETKRAVEQGILWILLSILFVTSKPEPTAAPTVESTQKPSTEDFYIPFIEKFVNPLLEATKNLGEKFTPVVLGL